MPRPYRTKQDERDVFRALAHPVRRRILAAALEQPRSFDELRRIVRRSNATVAQHLRILREAQVINAARSGRSVSYEVNRRALRSARQWFTSLDGTNAKK